MRNKIVMIGLMLIGISCVERTYTLTEDSSLDVTIGTLDSIYSFSMPFEKTVLVMIQKRDEVAKVFSYNVSDKENDSLKMLFKKALQLKCKEISEGLSKKEDYLIVLRDSKNAKTNYFNDCNTQPSIDNLKKYLLEIYHNSKKVSVFESSDELVLPPPPPLPEISLDSVRFFNNDK